MLACAKLYDAVMFLSDLGLNKCDYTLTQSALY